MTSLAIASQKGGVGKTTVALNLSLAFARRKWNTLLLDADPQGSVGQSLQNALRPDKGLAACLSGNVPLRDAVIKTRLPGLEILIAGESSMSLVDGGASLFAKPEGFGRILAEAERTYDLVVVDTPSGMYGITTAALRYVDRLLVPLQAEPLALRSVQQVLDAVGGLKQTGAKVSIAAFVITMLNSRSDVSLSVAQESWSMLPGDLVLDAFVPRDAAFLKASAYGVPLGLLSKRPPAVAAVFDQIASEMESRLDLVKEEENEGPFPLLD